MKDGKRKTIVGIFAHPDDEAFGPGGTIAKFAKESDVYLICATHGEAGKNNSTDHHRKLANIRKDELLSSAQILGVKKVYFLHYQDGDLSNNMYHKIAADIEVYLQKLKPDTLITFEPRGVSGHIDHVAISMITSFVFEKLSFVKKLLYFCISAELRARHEPYFIYFPPGYKKSEIDFVNDVSLEWDIKVKAMHEHKSQIADVKRILKRHEGLPHQENFLIKTK